MMIMHKIMNLEKEKENMYTESFLQYPTMLKPGLIEREHIIPPGGNVISN
jgi:hypothetical protein